MSISFSEARRRWPHLTRALVAIRAVLGYYPDADRASVVRVYFLPDSDPRRREPGGPYQAVIESRYNADWGCLHGVTDDGRAVLWSD